MTLGEAKQSFKAAQDNIAGISMACHNSVAEMDVAFKNGYQRLAIAGEKYVELLEQELQKAVKLKPMVQIDPEGRCVDPMFVIDVRIDQRFYANGSTTRLILEMRDTSTIVVEHGFGIDVYAIKEKILKAKRGEL